VTKKISSEDYILRLKQRLFPISIKENIGMRIEYKNKIAENKAITGEVHLRALIAEKGTRIFLESGSQNEKLRLIDFRTFKHVVSKDGESLIPLCGLVEEAAYNQDEKGDITMIYLGIEDSLVAPFRCGINNLEEQIMKERPYTNILTEK
jgi:hypothetical protein